MTRPVGATGYAVDSASISQHAAAQRDVLARLAEHLEGVAHAVRDLCQMPVDLVADPAPARLMESVQSAFPIPTATSGSDSPTTSRPLLSVADLGQLLGIDGRTVRRWRRAGKLPPAVPLSGVLRWRAEVVDAWIREREEAAR